jgi:hypothetical protein
VIRLRHPPSLRYGVTRGYGGQDQSNFCTSNQTKAESTAANVDKMNVARFVWRILKAGLGMSS